MLGALLALLLAALDQTIVGTAMPHIVQELNGLDRLSWVFTAYMLTSTISIPIIGKLSDIYGRKIFFLGGIGVFLLGSVLSGLSNSMDQLIIFRGIQGLGAGAIMANSFAIVGDLFTPRERGKWQGLFGAVFGLSSIIGPTLGGYLTDNATWRWNFFINVPVGILAMGVIWFLMPLVASHIKNRRVDYFGALSLAVTLVPLLLALVWGGTQYPWNSAQIIGLFVAALVGLGLFIWAERGASDPILPLHFFKNNVFFISAIVVFLTGVGMFGSILYIPLFAQNVIGISATNSGLVITPMTMGIVLSSIATGIITSRTGKYKWLAVGGMGILSLAFFLLSQVSATTSYLDLVWRMILVGVGLGVGFPIFNLAVQNAFDHEYMGVVTASTQLFRSLGGTVGVAIMGSVLNNSLHAKLGDLSHDPFVESAKTVSRNFDFANFDINKIQALLSKSVQDKITAGLSQLPPALQSQVLVSFHDFVGKLKVALASGIADVFMIGTVLVTIAFIATFFLKEIPLRKTHDQRGVAEEAGIELAEEEGQAPASAEPNLL